jgi:putative DNA methylase
VDQAQVTALDSKAQTADSPLRHLDIESIESAARIESRNREIHLPPVSVYRWWARRMESVNGAIVEAVSDEGSGSLLVADPFAGGGVIPLAAVLRGHRVYAQDLNPWAAEGLFGMLGMPGSTEIQEATDDLMIRTADLRAKAYETVNSQGEPAEIAHTIRVASSECISCGERLRLFPHGLVSLVRRRERGLPDAFLACPRGHVFRGKEGETKACPGCGHMTDPAANYTTRRYCLCWKCGSENRLADLSAPSSWRWEVVLVERSAGRSRELDLPSDSELRQASERAWNPTKILPEVPVGRETAVLLRHGFKRWHDLYPSRQRVLMESLLGEVSSASADQLVQETLRLAIVGSAEMAGLCSRWDRYYLKSYESMAGHRFNFSTLVVEPNVWGASASGRGTVRRRLQRFVAISDWLHKRLARPLQVDGPLKSTRRRSRMPGSVDVRVVEGSSERMLLSDGTVDLVLTDPPYHDDVEYDELSLPLRAWANQSLDRLDGSASVNQVLDGGESPAAYELLLLKIFSEAKRVLKPDGRLIFSYANREPAAWAALFGALQSAGLSAAGYAVIHSENETDLAKRNVRACTLDLIMDLVPGDHSGTKWHPTSVENSPEADFLDVVGSFFLRVGNLSGNWREELFERLRDQEFLAKPLT